MAEEPAGPFDVYADAFTITITPFGSNLTFAIREAHPSASQVPKVENLGTIRMSTEHLKTMVMMIRNQILQIEDKAGIKAEVSMDILNQMHLAQEDWDSFWRM